MQRRRQGALMKTPMFKSNDPKGTYQLWFKDGKQFQHVANIQAGNYTAAIILPLIRAGEDGSERVKWLVNVSRTISFRDKIVDPNGVAFEVYRPRFGGIALINTSHPNQQIDRELQERSQEM
jgi:hypothetical protein